MHTQNALADTKVILARLAETNVDDDEQQQQFLELADEIYKASMRDIVNMHMSFRLRFQGRQLEEELAQKGKGKSEDKGKATDKGKDKHTGKGEDKGKGKDKGKRKHKGQRFSK